MANDLNTARDIYKRYDKLRKSRTASSSQKFDALKAANERLESLGLRFASIREMDELYQAGRLSKEDAIVRFDREPMPVSGNEDVARLEETPMYQTGNGQLYYSERGDFLPGDDRGFADLLDPFTTLSRQQDHISSQAATSSYVAHEVPRWIARFGKYMEVKGVEDPGILDLFRHGTWKKATPDEIQAEGEAFREFHNMTMGTPTESSAALARWNEKMAKKIERYMNTSRKFKDSERAQEAGRWMTDKLIDGKDPVGILKGWTYDMTLGAFNFGQLILQGSAFAAVVSISPKYGALAFKDWFHLRAAAFNPNAVEPMGKAWALMTGGSVDEFKLMVDDLRRSGLMDVAATDTLLERASSLEGGTGAAGLLNRLSQAGRVPVYEGERINRITAFGVARREALDKVNDGTLEAGSDAYHTYIQGRTSALTMNMISGSEAWWQGNKFTSLGTQFWAYPARVVESMLNVATVGKLGNRTLSTRENFQFLLGQGMMWGTAGVPLATSVYNWVTEGLGTQLDEDTHRTITTGFIDRALHEMSGGRINSAIGKNLGAGPFLADLIDTIMEGDALGLVGGVSAVKIRTGLGSFMNTIAMLNEAENVGGADYSIELMKEMGRLFKGVNNATRAYAVAKYGLLLDSRGQNVIGEEDPMNAFIVFTGFPLAQQAQLYDYTGRSSKNYKSTVDGLGKLLAAQRLEYYLWSLERDRDPKKGDWIMNKQKAIADLIDNPKMLDDVRNKAKNTLEGNGWRALFKNQGKLNYIPEGEQ
jgi:hypothetical protein